MKKLVVVFCAIALSSALLARTSIKRDIFTDGEFFVGCNYWAKNAGMYMWSSWDPDAVEREIAALAKYGTRVMRVFPLWPDFYPLTGDCHGGGSYRSFGTRTTKSSTFTVPLHDRSGWTRVNYADAPNGERKKESQ